MMPFPLLISLEELEESEEPTELSADEEMLPELVTSLEFFEELHSVGDNEFFAERYAQGKETSYPFITDLLGD